MGRKSLVESGQRYARLLVIQKIAVKRWQCKCDCGKVVTRGSVALLHGDTLSCGCHRSEAQITLDLIGQRFERLLVLIEMPRKNPRVRRWLCLCDCGELKIANQADLRNGNTRSCGCLQQEHRSMVSRFSRRTHSRSRHPLFVTWRNMMDRCYKSQHADFKNYGGRGITVCERWHQIENYIADMGEKPYPKATVERKDNNGNYCPDNCTWADRTTQCRNRRNTYKVLFNGENRILIELANEYKMPSRVVWERVSRYKWSVKRALTTPIAPSTRRSPSAPAAPKELRTPPAE